VILLSALVFGDFDRSRKLGQEIVLPCFRQIMDQMKPVVDLNRKGQCLSNGFGVTQRSVSGDNLDLWSLPQPLGNLICFTRIYHIDYSMCFPTHENGAVAGSFLKCKIIDSDDWMVFVCRDSFFL